MASYNLAPIGNGFQFFTTGGLPLNAGQLFTYAAGTSTPQATYTTSAGSIANSNPIILGVDGRTPSEIWLTTGVSYKFVLEDSLGNIIATYDNLTGINDVVTAASEWSSTGYSPTYVGPTSFSVTGDRTATYQQYRRIRATVAGGSIYGSIVSSIFAAGVTTVTLVMDSTSLDNSLTAVDVAFLNATNPSVPASLTFAGPVNEAQGTAIASAATINLTTATGNYIHITGSTTITAITLAAGYERTVVFDGALTITNGANLILPGSTNINTQAGDVAIFRGETGGATRCTVYQTGVSRQILPVTASVATNALTVGINPTALAFRDTTLTTGVPVTIGIPALSLTVPSSATLGTVNATQARLVILVINNAGTPELAIVNLAGGNNLDETTLISTTAISASATASNVIYSTSARTNVAFRVVGFVDITEATAGTWATAPTLVQGAGGQAIVTLDGQTWQNVTGSRALGTTYYNTTGKEIDVLIQYSSTSGSAILTMTINGVAVTVQTSAPTTGSTVVGAVTIPAGASYSAAISPGTPTLNNWFELR